MIRALVAAAYPTVRAGLAALLRTGVGVEVIGEASGADDLLTQATSLAPDVVLLELEADNEELVNAVWRLAEIAPGANLVLLCDAEDLWSTEALRAGARGILPRDASAKEIVAAVIAAGQGLVVLHRTAVQALLPLDTALAPIPASVTPLEALTPREAEVLRLLGEGMSNKIISRKLGISEHTVKFHVGAIMAKLGAGSRTEAVTVAARSGLIML